MYNEEGTSQILTFFKNIIVYALESQTPVLPADGNSMLCLQTENHAYVNQFLNCGNRKIWAAFAALKQRHI